MKSTIDQVTRQAKAQRKVLNLELTETRAEVAKAKSQRRRPRQEALIIRGPYQDQANKFRLKIAENGETKSVCFKTRKEAEQVKKSLLAKSRRHQGVTIANAIPRFHTYLLESRGILPHSAAWCAHQLAWLPGNRLLSSISEPEAERLYRNIANGPSNKRTGKPVAVATHHGWLLLAKRLYAWARTKGLCSENPFAAVRPMGRQRVGKLQLRIDEARRFESKAMELAHDGSAPALGALLMLYLGLRQGEVAARVARDIDDDGRVLWVPSGKTKNARRRLKVPEKLRPLLLSLVHSQGPDRLLFCPTDRPPATRYFWGWVRRICVMAGVPKVCPHSLRGLHATLALEGGATSDSVAKALGHGSFELTARHYATEDSVSNSSNDRFSQIISNHEPSTADKLVSILKSLSTKELAEVLSKATNPSTTSDDKHHDSQFPSHSPQ